MGYLKKEISIGFLISIIATVCGVFLYIQYFSKYGFEETIQMILKGNLYAKVLSLAALPNLFVFFVFIKKKQDYSCLLYTSPSPRDRTRSRMPSSA